MKLKVILLIKLVFNSFHFYIKKFHYRNVNGNHFSEQEPLKHIYHNIYRVNLNQCGNTFVYHEINSLFCKQYSFADTLPFPCL